VRPHLKKKKNKKLGMVAYTYDLNYTRGISRRIMVQAFLGKNVRLYLKIYKQKKEGLGYGESSREPA
jgi:hypothetical protein